MRRILLALAVAAIGWTAVANNLPAAPQPPAVDWSRPHSIRAGGLTVYYPRAWRATTRADGAQVVISSGRTLILLVEYGSTQAGSFPPRPDRFELRDGDRHFLSCLGFQGWNVIFTDDGRAVQAFVRLGSGTRKSDAAEVLDRLAVGTPD